MALKRSSEVITISGRLQQGVVNAFEVNPVDLQLNPLDQEVFVVTAVKIDFLSKAPHQLIVAGGGWSSAEFEVGLTTTRPTSMPTLGDSNCFAFANRQTVYYVDAAGDFTVFSENEQGPADTPDTNLDYIGIIATSDMFVSIDGDGSSHVADIAYRVYGYRAKADAATYAALVQSEVLSS